MALAACSMAYMAKYNLKLLDSTIEGPVERSRHRKDVAANYFGFQARAGHSPEQLVFRVNSHSGRHIVAGHAICLRLHHELITAGFLQIGLRIPQRLLKIFDAFHFRGVSGDPFRPDEWKATGRVE